jgi:circadian clock protein KaiB
MKSDSPASMQSKSGAQPSGKIQMTLFIAGEGANSRAAMTNINDLCENEMPGKYFIEVVDVLENLSEAARHSIVVTPTLLVHMEHKDLRVIGNLKKREKLRAVLGLEGN